MFNKFKMAFLAVAGCALATGTLINNAYAIPLNDISQVIFFGDSLSDSGFYDLWNTSPSGPLPPNKAPTFTTFGGYTWAQYVAHDIMGLPLPVYPGPTPADTITNNTIYAGATPPVSLFVSGSLHGVDYAAAGSTTNGAGFGETFAPSLHQQVAYYIATQGPNVDPNAVYFVWSGSNDILSVLLTPPTPTELQLTQTALTAAINIANEVALLSSKGAKRIVVVSLPNIGVTPLLDALGVSNPTLPGSIKNLSFTFNSMLNTALGRVRQLYNTKILLSDSYDLLDNVIIATQAGKPYVVSNQSFLFSNYNSPACGSLVTPAIYCTSAAPTDYIFADAIHPTGMSQLLFSLQIENELSSWS